MSLAQVNLLNYRYDGKPFMNHLHISQVRNSAGKVRPVSSTLPLQGFPSRVTSQGV